MEKLKSAISAMKAIAEDNKPAVYCMAAVGAALCVSRLLTIAGSICKYTLRPSRDLRKRYGDGWALVTGASDGIGKAYATELARRGFKVGLIARNEAKLKAVANEIGKKYGVETKCITFDFNVFYTDEVIAKLKTQLEAFDRVSILINNVGVGYRGVFHLMPDHELQALLNVNVHSVAFVTKILIPKLLENDSKSGIINVGSDVMRQILPNFSWYSGTKAFITQFSDWLRLDYQDKIDVMTAIVGPTKTNLNKGILVLSSNPESWSKHTLDWLGWDKHTFGDYRHGLRDYYLHKPIERKIIEYIDNKRLEADKDS